MEQVTKVKVKDSAVINSPEDVAGSRLVTVRQRFALLGFIVLNCWVLLSLKHDGLLLAQILPACWIIACVLLLKFFQR